MHTREDTRTYAHTYAYIKTHKHIHTHTQTGHFGRRGGIAAAA
jgi:hypothetical protein